MGSGGNGAAATPLDVSEMRPLLLELLREIDAFCRERGIDYYLYAGTLLGAVRHGGFIPWDDDIDVMMARRDYDRFCAEFRDGGSSYLVTSRSRPSFPYAYAKVCRTGTLVEEEVDLDPADAFGINVDVLPFDPVSSHALVFRLQLAVAWTVRALLLLKVVQGRPGRPWHVRSGLAVTRVLLAPLSVRWLTRARTSVATWWSGRSSDHVAMLIASAPWRVPVSWIAPSVSIRFEEELFPAPADCHGFLTAVYGNYRVPPPVQHRVVPHRSTAFLVPDPGAQVMGPTEGSPS